MFRRFVILGLTLAGLSTSVPSVAQTKVYYHHPKGYYYNAGRWRPYRGPGYPYRGGYYDRWGHWHRY